MWILKTSKDLLEYIQSKTLLSCKSNKTCLFSYPLHKHSTIKKTIERVGPALFQKKRNYKSRNKYLVLRSDTMVLCKNGNIFLLRLTDVFFVFEQTIGIAMGTSSSSLFVSFFIRRTLYTETVPFNFTFSYKHEFFSLNNLKFGKICCTHLFHRTWDKGYNRYISVWLIV